jgi:hypothetical protein
MAQSFGMERIGKGAALSRMKRVVERAQAKGLLHEINSPCMLPAHVDFDLMNRVTD